MRVVSEKLDLVVIGKGNRLFAAWAGVLTHPPKIAAGLLDFIPAMRAGMREDNVIEVSRKGHSAFLRPELLFAKNYAGVGSAYVRYGTSG